MSLTAKVDLIAQKLDRLIEDQQEALVWRKQYEQRLGIAERQIGILQDRLQVK